MKLYEFGPTRSIRVRWTLQELGVPFEAETVNLIKGEHKSPAFLALNPAGKLPVLVDGDLVLNESVAIAIYLAEKYPEKSLMPKDPKARADLIRQLFFIATELEQPLWRIARNTNVYPEPDRVAADIPVARRDFSEMAAVMEKHMRGREFVAGDRFTVADPILAYTLDWANLEELLGDCPALRTYMDRMYARPQAAMRIADAFAAIRS